MDDYPWSTRWLHHLGSHHIWRGCIKDASWLRPKCFQPERRANQATTEHQTNRDDDMERSYLGENTASHQHSAVKLRWALSVLSSVTPWEPRVTFCYAFSRGQFALKSLSTNPPHIASIQGTPRKHHTQLSVECPSTLYPLPHTQPPHTTGGCLQFFPL